MATRLTLDKAGRIVLPKPVREKLELAPGDELELDDDDEEITLRPLRGNAPLRKKHGVWVYRAGVPLTVSVVEDNIDQVRRERDEQTLGHRR